MTKDSWFVQVVDHRISMALIFFLLLMLIGNRKRRTMFPLRLLVSLLMM